MNGHGRTMHVQIKCLLIRGYGKNTSILISIVLLGSEHST